MSDLFDAAADRLAYESGRARSQVVAELRGAPSLALPLGGLFDAESESDDAAADAR